MNQLKVPSCVRNMNAAYVMWLAKPTVLFICKRCLANHSLYKRLGVKPDATQAEIRQAYIQLSKKFHPDAKTEYSSAEKFAEVNAAYEVLAKPDSRRLYDQEQSATAARRRRPVYGTSAAARGDSASGRRPAYDERVRMDADWMFRDAGWNRTDYDSEKLRDYKFKLGVAIVGIFAAVLAIRMVMSVLVNSARERQELLDFHFVMSLLKPEQRERLREDLSEKFQQELTQIQRDNKIDEAKRRAQSLRRQRQQEQQMLQPQPEQSEVEVMAEHKGKRSRVKTVTQSHNERRQQQRLEQFRLKARSWPAATREALRPRLSADLVEQLNIIEQEEEEEAAAAAAAASNSVPS